MNLEAGVGVIAVVAIAAAIRYCRTFEGDPNLLQPTYALRATVGNLRGSLKQGSRLRKPQGWLAIRSPLARWSALLLRFARCLGVSVPKLFPRLKTERPEVF